MQQRAVADGLRELGRLLEALGEPVYRVRAHERAARTLDYLGEDELARRVDERSLRELPNIGEALARKIEQLYRSGTTPELEELRRKVPSEFRELSRIEGLGPKRILALHQALGIDTVDDLLRAIQDGRVRGVRGFTAASEARLVERIAAARQRVEISLWLDAVREADRLAARLAGPGVHAVWLAGPSRRAHEQATGVTLVVEATAPAASAVGAVATAGLLKAESSGTSLLGCTADGLPVEVRFVPTAEAPAALLFATGPEEHVAALVARAASRGWRLDPSGLHDGTSRLPVPDERALYAALDLPWVPPERRDDPDVWSAGSEELDALVQVADLVGMVHCHSTFSDGRDSIEDLARACDARGIAYLTITDHSPSASYAGGCEIDTLKRQWEEIDRVQQTVRVRILKGTESDILADGALDYPDAILEQLDVVIASIHGRHRMDRDAMTRRLVHMMRLPIFKIWGHGLGRLVGRRPPIECDVEAVLDAAAASRVAIEINSDPHRLDLPPEWAARARVRGIPFVISADAHSVAGLSVLPFGVGIARRAGIRRDEVLNTRPVAAFRAAVRPVP